MARWIVRGALVASMLVALVVGVVCIRNLGLHDSTTWAISAAVLAILAAVISAWTGQRVLELQEDALLPNPVPSIDLRRRYQLAQFRIANEGGSPAFRVAISWSKQLTDAQGKPVGLGSDQPIPVIPSGQAASVVLGLPRTFLARSSDSTFTGTITFRTASSRRLTRQFVISLEHERTALVHDEEAPKTLYELQRVPDALERIAQEVNDLAARLGPGVSEMPSNKAMQQADGAPTGRGDSDGR